MSWRDAVPLALQMLLQKDSRVDPHLEILRLGVEHEDVGARDVSVTLVLDGALITGTAISTDTWERLYLRQLGDQNDTLRRVVRDAVGTRHCALLSTWSDDHSCPRAARPPPRCARGRCPSEATGTPLTMHAGVQPVPLRNGWAGPARVGWRRGRLRAAGLTKPTLPDVSGCSASG